MPKSKASWKFFEKNIHKFTEHDLDYIQARYDGEILEVDHKFSLLLDTLKNRKLMNRTIIVFTSDHGESFAEREHMKKIGHHIMYEDNLHVPLMIKIPGLNKQVSIANDVESIDIMPTILNMLKIENKEKVDGENLFEKTKAYSYSEHFCWDNSYSIKQDNVKLIFYREKNKFELYDLQKDPIERDNIFGTGHPMEKQAVEKLLSVMPQQKEGSDQAIVDDETIEQLKALGYLNKN